MTRPTILVGCWSRRMCAELAAIYCGELNTAAFLKRVGKEYPQPADDVVLAGILRWPDYRSKEWPSAIKILHHKTGAVVWHPLEETVEETTIQFYAEAEAILAQLPRRGVPMILREVKTGNGAVFKPFSYSGFEKIVQQLRKQIEGVPSYFTLDACRHGGDGT